MRSLPRTWRHAGLAAVASLFIAGSASAAVAVGSSTLIQTLDYSDTFTLTAHGGNPNRVEGAFPVHADALIIENAYGNPVVSWTPSNAWSLNTDASAATTTPSPYPGTSSANSSTGMTQTGGNSGGWRIPYTIDGTTTGDPLRTTDIVIQMDAVLQSGVTLTSGNMSWLSLGFSENLTAGNRLSVLFRAAGGNFTVFNGATATNVPAVTSALAGDQWHNFAISITGATGNILTAYANEIELFSVDLDTFAGGIYATYNPRVVGTTFFNEGTGSVEGRDDRMWTDNFQVGLVPEPAALSLLGLAGLAMLRRRR